MQPFKVISFHPRSADRNYRIFVNKRSGFCKTDQELHVLGLALIELNNGSTTPTFKIVPTFIYEGETIFGAEDWDADKYDSEIVIVDPNVENVADYVYSEFARILPCPELDGVEQ